MKKNILLILMNVLFILGCGGPPKSTSPTPTLTATAIPTKITPTSTPWPTIAPRTFIEPDGKGCTVTAPPAGTDEFYTKYCSAGRMAILSSSEVPDLALQQAWYIVMNMSAQKPHILDVLAEQNVTIGIIGKYQVVTDMPEYSDLPPSEWNYARGLGATEYRPLSSGAEENLLCFEQDVYRGENIFVHEFAHTFIEMGIAKTDPKFISRVEEAYQQAVANGLWVDTYAHKDWKEYWAEGAQSYFNSNLEGFPSTPATEIPPGTPTPIATAYPNGNGIHNFVNTRDELKQYDPALYNLLAEVFPAFDWSPQCPATTPLSPTPTLTPIPIAAGGAPSSDSEGSGEYFGGFAGEGGYPIFSGTVQADRLSCRYGPGAPYLYKTGLIKGNLVQVIGRNDAGDWVYIQHGDTIQCWVNVKYLQVTGSVSELELAYPDKAPLILFSHPKFPPPANVQAARSTDRVVITWVGYELALGDRESAESPIYLVETWTCQDGKIVFTATGAFEEVAVISDEAGCSEPSRGQVYIAHKDGYIGPVPIQWPK